MDRRKLAVSAKLLAVGTALVLELFPALSATPTSTITQYSYDIRGRVVCTAVRMNWDDPSGSYGTEPADACAQSTATTYGPDRITKNTYDNAGQLVQVTRALGTSQQQNYATYTYTQNGKQASAADANGNLTTYTYDGFDRLVQTTFPSPATGSGQVNTSDYEAYSYDNNNNRLALRKRDGQVINYTYDALNRAIVKDLPGGTSGDVYYDYDMRGLTITSNFGSLTGVGITYSYDYAGRKLAENSYSQPIAYEYDVRGRRTKMTWPDGYYVTYGYDWLDRMIAACENGTFNGNLSSPGCSSGTTLATFSYDNLGRPAWIQYGAGSPAARVSYSWSNLDDLLTLGHSLANSANNVSFTDSYSPIRQVTQSTISNSAYLYIPTAVGTTSYTANGLNQYAAITPPGGSATSIGYDANANLTSDGTFTYTYDPENRLIAASNSNTGVSATYLYDPAGRRRQKAVSGGSNSGTTQFLSSGDDEIAEYNGSGALLLRYVAGPSVDHPIAMVTAAGVKTFFHQDKTGSVVAMSDTSGNLVEGPYVYDPYGNCMASGMPCASGVAYKYTGRRYDPETGLYYYRARYYSPVIGRFLQTDPIGYKDDLDLYTYVANDPTDKTDPTGEVGLDSLFEAGGGALVGVVGVGITDVMTGHLSSAEEYTGAAVGGATTGVLLGAGVPMPLAAGMGSAAGDATKQGIAMLRGKQDSFNVAENVTETAKGTALGAVVGNAKIPGVTAGRNSYSAVAKTAATKMENGTIKKVSPQTIVKGVTAAGASDALRKTSEALHNAIENWKKKLFN